MYKLLMMLGLVVVLAGCKHDFKPQQANQAQTATTPTLDQTGHQIGEVSSSAFPTAVPSNSTPTSTVPASDQSPQPSKPSAFQPAPVPAPPIDIPAGTPVRVRLNQTIDTKRNRPGDRFEARLISPILVNGQLVVPGGTTFEGHVTEAKPSGRFKGRALLGVELDSFRLSGVVYPVVTTPDTRVSGRHRKRNWILMGGGSGLGATLGALAGGGAGALIGAGAGVGAGAVAAFFTGRKNVSLPAETPLTFHLRTEVALTSGRSG